MGLFGKSHASPGQERVETLLNTAMKYGPGSKECDDAQFAAAVEALRGEGQAAQDYLEAEAKKGVSVKHLDAFWATVVAMGDPMVPGVQNVLKTGGSTSQRRAVLALCAFAEKSPAVRDQCVASLREAAESGETELISQDAGRCLQALAEKGILSGEEATVPAPTA